MIFKQSPKPPKHIPNYHGLIINAIKQGNSEIIEVLKTAYLPVFMDVVKESEDQVEKILSRSLLEVWQCSDRQRLTNISKFEYRLFGYLLGCIKNRPAEEMLGQAGTIRMIAEADRWNWNNGFRLIFSNSEEEYPFDMEGFKQGSYQSYCTILGVLYPWAFMLSYNQTKSIRQSAALTGKIFESVFESREKYDSWKAIASHIKSNLMILS